MKVGKIISVVILDSYVCVLESRQNELYLKCQSLGGTFIRDKQTSQYQVKTTHLVVGVLEKTEKVLSGLAAGIPLVSDLYIFA